MVKRLKLSTANFVTSNRVFANMACAALRTTEALTTRFQDSFFSVSTHGYLLFVTYETAILLSQGHAVEPTAFDARTQGLYHCAARAQLTASYHG